MRKRLKKKQRKRRVAQIVEELSPPKYSIDTAVGPGITVVQAFEMLFEEQAVKDIQQIEDGRTLEVLWLTTRPQRSKPQ